MVFQKQQFWARNTTDLPIQRGKKVKIYSNSDCIHEIWLTRSSPPYKETYLNTLHDSFFKPEMDDISQVFGPSKIHIILVSLIKKEKLVWLTNDDKPFSCIAYRNASSILQYNDWKPASYKQIYGPCKSTSSSVICTNYWNLPALTRLILYIQVQAFITEILLLHAFGHQEDHVN